MKIKNLFFVLIFCYGCSKVVPRKPISPRPSSTVFKQTIKEYKRINTLEEDKIKTLIANDSTKKYLLSPNGFWYTYIHKIEENLPTPKTAQEVTFAYSIADFKDSVIYSTKELGIKKYIVDKEDFISGLQYGIKLMKIGETITFVLPYYNAFGSTGDGNKIKANQSIKSTVTLINIK